MGRGVFVPSRASNVVYIDVGAQEDSLDWDDAIDDVVWALKARYPSLSKPGRQRWVGNEGRVILENKLVDIVVAKYCGVASLSVVPREDGDALAERWARQVNLSYAAGYLGRELKRLGSMSNGESVYQVA